MILHTTEKFWKLYSALPVDIRKQAKIAYIQFKNNPYHPSLQFKRTHSSKPVCSVRINIDYRAVGIIDNVDILWFWIDSHREYEKILQKL
ncbi:MAG: hypothetical protein D0528_07025 [Methylococcales bacterium]|nr:MAG: hypothetical protein D0528_07025 [Methylococcales bacterium]